MPILKHSMEYTGYDTCRKVSPTKCYLTVCPTITDKAEATKSQQNNCYI
jgi:hypothetical protein